MVPNEGNITTPPPPPSKKGMSLGNLLSPADNVFRGIKIITKIISLKCIETVFHLKKYINQYILLLIQLIIDIVNNNSKIIINCYCYCGRVDMSPDCGSQRPRFKSHRGTNGLWQDIDLHLPLSTQVLK